MGYVRQLWTASLRQSWPLYLIVIGCFGLGILLGSVGVNTLQEDQTAELQRYLQTFLAQAGDINIDRSQMAKGALYDNLLVGVIIYILGLTIICLPLVLAFIFIRGFVLGFTVSFLIKNPKFQDVIIILVSMLPHNIFFIPALIISGTISLSFSILLIKRFFNSQTLVWPQFIVYTMIMAGCMLVYTIAALTEGYLTPELTRFLASMFAGW